MADIAMLVAEEFERRVKSSSKGVSDGENNNKNMELMSWASSLVAQRVRNKIVGDDDNKNIYNLEISKWVLEPRSQLSIAASDGLFSA